MECPVHLVRLARQDCLDWTDCRDDQEILDRLDLLEKMETKEMKDLLEETEEMDEEEEEIVISKPGFEDMANTANRDRSVRQVLPDLQEEMALMEEMAALETKEPVTQTTVIKLLVMSLNLFIFKDTHNRQNLENFLKFQVKKNAH